MTPPYERADALEAPAHPNSATGSKPTTEAVNGVKQCECALWGSSCPTCGDLYWVARRDRTKWAA